MIQYTTPTLHLVVEDVDITEQEVYVTIRQGRHETTISDVELTLEEEDTHIRVPMTQEQTGNMRRGDAEVQVNWLDQAGHRSATTIGKIAIAENLLARVVEHE